MTYNGEIKELKSNQVFVFGSNTQGRHGKGAALIAKRFFGAKYGQAKGIQGQSYAIVTKDISSYPYKSMSKDYIINEIKHLYQFAVIHPYKEFYIAYKGNGINLNGYSSIEMAEMFSFYPIPINIIFEETFKDLIKSN